MVLSMVFISFSLAVLAGLFFVNEFYFKPAEKGLGERTLISFEASARIDAEGSLQKIDKELQENAVLNELEKQSDWPPALEQVKKENLNPFSKPAEKMKK